jgi:DNA-binding response OmpR family regulator
LTQFDENSEQTLDTELSTEKLKNIDKSTILLVEDNPDMRNYLIQFLNHNFLVMDAKDGQEGLNKAIAEIPDLIISDIMMPRMDGFQLCEKLKSSPLTSHIPIILLTAKGSADCKIEGLEHGAVDYLTKPFDKQELLLRIQNLLQIQKAQQELLQRQITAIDVKIAKLRISSADDKFLRKAFEIIEANLDDSEFNVNDLAQNIGFSRTHLNRKIYALTGLKTNELIRSIRLKMAARLLKSKDGSVSEIAYKVGFNHLSYFARCFKKQYGIEPSEYGD